MRAVIVIPAHNEEGNISSLLDDLTAYRDRYDVVVIDDASEDQTAQIVRERGVPLIELKANLGIGGAMQTGFKYAASHNYDIVIQVDGDGQHDPVWLDSLVAPITGGTANCVIGSRYTSEHMEQDYEASFPRRAGMLFSTLILFLATGKLIRDTTSGFRALDRGALMYFARNYPVDHPEAEALLMLHQAGFKIKEVPVRMRTRQAGDSSVTWLKAAQYPFRVLVGFMGLFLNKKR